MTTRYTENRRKVTIISIVSAVLVLAIVTAAILLTPKHDTTVPTPTIEVGKRIDTSKGGGA